MATVGAKIRLFGAVSHLFGSLRGAQLQAELFGLLAPGMPEEAVRRGRYFVRVTNSGLAVEDGVCIIPFE